MSKAEKISEQKCAVQSVLPVLELLMSLYIHKRTTVFYYWSKGHCSKAPTEPFERIALKIWRALGSHTILYTNEKTAVVFY